MGSPSGLIVWPWSGVCPAFFIRQQVQTSLPKPLGQSNPNFLFIDWVFVMGRWANVHVIHFDWGVGANVQYRFESGGKCPPMLIIGGGADILTYHFS